MADRGAERPEEEGVNCETWVQINKLAETLGLVVIMLCGMYFFYRLIHD